MRPVRRLFLLALLSIVISCSAWEWVDVVSVGDGVTPFQTKTLSMDQVSDMRVRDIKRRLTRAHGYSADELGRILDKKELIQALSFEEHKERSKEKDKVKRFLLIRGIFTALGAVAVVAGWPVWKHLYEVGHVNFVVYKDRKMYETTRCFELKAHRGMLGVLLMALIDALQMWLTVSILLSWFMRSKYFFPSPSLTVNPAQMMGGKVAQGPLGRYGMNVGPMAVTWVMRFLYGRIQSWTGRALSQAYQSQKKESRQWESTEERVARKAARKAAKKAARQEAEMKKREAEKEEAERRKQSAGKATDELFPTQHAQHAQQNANAQRQEESRRQFEEQMEGFGLDELD